jgi:hypothetical protein
MQRAMKVVVEWTNACEPKIRLRSETPGLWNYLPVGVVLNVREKVGRTVFHLQSCVNDFLYWSWEMLDGKMGSDAVRSFRLTSESDRNCIAGPLERLIAVQIFAAHFLKPLLVFTAAFVVRAEIVSAILDYFVTQFFALRTTGTLEAYDEEQYRYGKYESQSFLHFLLLHSDYPKEKLLNAG